MDKEDIEVDSEGKMDKEMVGEMDRGRQGDTDVTRRQGGGHWTVKKNFLSVCLAAL